MSISINPPSVAAALDDFIETWAAHCGAPREVFVGHLSGLLVTARLAEREAVVNRLRAALAAELNLRRIVAEVTAPDDSTADAARDLDEALKDIFLAQGKTEAQWAEFYRGRVKGTTVEVKRAMLEKWEHRAQQLEAVAAAR